MKTITLLSLLALSACATPHLFSREQAIAISAAGRGFQEGYAQSASLNPTRAPITINCQRYGAYTTCQGQ